MADRQRVDLEIDAGEMFDSQSWSVPRKDIQWDGAAAIGDQFGRIGIRVNGQLVLTAHLHEDGQGRVVLETQQWRQGHMSGMANVIELERDGIVPPRPDGSVSKREKWGG